MRIPPRLRPYALWIGFSCAAIATAFATYRLYDTARQEISVQSEQALQQSRTEILESIRTYTEQVRLSTIKDLASFHVDGLRQMMQRWDDANETINGTFFWDQKNGFRPSANAATIRSQGEDVVRLWQEFRKWRSAHPTDTKWEEQRIGHYRIHVYVTRANPALPETELGYQNENLDILSHAGRPVDPWAGWAAVDNDPEAPWIFWYQGGPDDMIRGCLVDVKSVMTQLRINKSDTRYARGRVEATSHTPGPESGSNQAVALAELPSYQLTLDTGDLFKDKANSAAITAAIAAALFGIFVLGGVALTLYTRKEAHDAERKTNFVAQVSHELRTPLTSIRMYADLLGQPDLADTKRLKFAATIGKESSRLGTMVERLLAFNAVERGSTKIVRTTVAIGPLIDEVIEETRDALQSAKLAVELEPIPQPIIAQTDYSFLKQALINLLDNATKYARDGGSIRIRVRQTADQVQIDVVDFGPGVPHAMRHRIFEPFVQVNQTLTNKSPGVGLGLSLARQTLRLVGADLVLLESTQGAIFQIQMPSSPKSAVSQP